jgi:hypothetical protein
MTVSDVRAVIGGREVARDEILACEAKRLPKGAARIGLTVASGDLAEQRLALADAKLALGAEEVRRRLAGQLRVSDLISGTTARLSGGRRATSICDLYATGGDASSFVDWFMDSDRPDYERSMLAAHPDHFLISAPSGGAQEVIETTGGSPLPARFLIDYEDLATLRSPVQTGYEADASGVARSASGAAIGGVRHQFRNTDDGFHAHLVVEFPKLMAPHMLSQHRWHLAVEFSNWIEFAFA